MTLATLAHPIYSIALLALLACYGFGAVERRGLGVGCLVLAVVSITLTLIHAS